MDWYTTLISFPKPPTIEQEYFEQFAGDTPCDYRIEIWSSIGGDPPPPVYILYRSTIDGYNSTSFSSYDLDALKTLCEQEVGQSLHWAKHWGSFYSSDGRYMIRRAK